MKAWDIAIKNLKLIFRNKMLLPVIILIPIFYYSLMGLTFGSSGGVDISQYTVGFINGDINTNVSPINSYQSLGFMVDTITNTSGEDQTALFQMENFTVLDAGGFFDSTQSIELAKKALVEEGVIAYALFDAGFQQGLNNAADKRIGIFANDSSTNPSFDPRLKPAMVYDLLAQMQYTVINLSADAFHTALDDFQDYSLDYLLRIDEGYEAAIVASSPPAPQISAFFPSYVDNAKSDLFLAILNASLNQIVVAATGNMVNFTSSTLLVDGSPVFPSYTLYFLSSTSPTTISIINQTFTAILDGILNYNPDAITLNASFAYTEGKAISNLTYNSPGYLLYGLLNIMSFAMIMLTTEIKEGLFKRLLSSRMKTRDLLIGNTIANTIVSFIQVIIGVATLMIWGMRPYYFSLGTLIGGMIINTLAISLFLNSLALMLVPVFKSPDAAAGGVWLLLIPLMTFSGAFFPVEFISPAFANFVGWIPTRMTVLAYQAIMINGLPLTAPKFWLNVVMQVGMGLCLYALGLFAFYRFTRSEKQIRKKAKKNENSE